MYRKDYLVIVKIVTLSVLSALGFILMSFVQIPYPGASFLKIEISDTIVLVAYSLYSFSGATLVAIFKTLLDFALRGPSGAYFIGNITALITSLIYVLGLLITSKVFKLFTPDKSNKKVLKVVKVSLLRRILGYVIIILIVSFSLVLLNAFIITPIYLTGQLTTGFDPNSRAAIIEGFNTYGIKSDFYFLAILILYLPFNLLKGSLVCLSYEIIFNRMIFIYLKRTPIGKKYMFKPLISKKEELKCSSEDEYRYIYYD